jgi:hypothetical protein
MVFGFSHMVRLLPLPSGQVAEHLLGAGDVDVKDDGCHDLPLNQGYIY